ncbi:MAG: DNA-directed RNA polymerase subunit K [Candidatus Micrarchaeota archaeon]
MAKQHMVLTKYELARLIGARSLQLAMGAPCLVKSPKGIFNAVKLAMFEYEKNALPLQVVRAPVQ